MGFAWQIRGDMIMSKNSYAESDVIKTSLADLTRFTDIELAKELISRGWVVQRIGVGYVLVEPRGAAHPKEQSCEKC